MSITIKRFSLEAAGQPAMTVFIEGEKDTADFKELIQRGSNLWPDASATIKECADLITNGSAMQPYHTMSGEKKS